MGTSSCFHVTQVEEIKRIVGEAMYENEVVGPNGSPVSGGGGGIRILAGSDGAPLDVFDLYSTGLPRKLTLPSPYSGVGPAMVHPSVVYVPNRWMGWSYWMAVTPYPLNDSQYENPCVLVSQDGELWEVPPGLNNPIVPKPAGGYNADTELVMSPDGSRLYLLYRERIAGVANRVKCLESSDGITWTAPVTILTGTYGSQDYASPSVWWDSVAGVWRMISHNLDGGATYPMNVLATSGADIYSGWGAPSAVTIANPTGGRTWWHSQFRRLPDGRIVGLVQDTANGGSGASGALFVAESLDTGSTFAVAPMYSDASHYRCSFVVRDGESGPSVAAFIGRLGAGSVFAVWRDDWIQGAARRRREVAAAEYAITGVMPANVLWFDNFNRADGAIGTPIVGSALAVDAGTLTIASNRIASGSAGNNRGLVSVGRADYAVDVKFSASASAAWLLVRAVDAANFWRIGLGSGLPGTIYRERIAAGASAGLVAITGPVNGSAIAAGDLIRVACRGRRIRLYVNGVMWSEWADPVLYATGVRIGVQGTNAGTAFDDLLCIA